LEGRELRGRRGAVQLLERPQRRPVVADLRGGVALGVAVVGLRPAPEAQDQLVDAQPGTRAGGGQAPAGRLPLGDDAGGLLAAGAGAVLAEQVIVAAAHAVGEGDDRLAGLPVAAVGGDGRLAGHETLSAEDFRSIRGFVPRFRPPEGTPEVRSAEVFTPSEGD